MVKSKRTCYLGSIINRHNGIGFDLVFHSVEEAQHYKDMFDIILRSDNYRTVLSHGYYDKTVED